MADKKPSYDLGSLFKTGGNPARQTAKQESGRDEASTFLKKTSNTKTSSLSGQPLKQKSKSQLPAVSNPDGKDNR